MSENNRFAILQQLIDEAISKNEPYDKYIKEQIHLLEMAHDQFVESATEQGYDIIHDQRVGDIRIRQFTAMKQLALKIGLPSEPYDEKIKQIRIGLFGEANYHLYFGQQAKP